MFDKKQTVISDTDPLVVGSLKVYPEKIECGAVRCSFFDIESVGWYWLSQTINLINTQDARLTLYVKGLEKPIEVSKSTMYVTPKLVTAYQFIAQKTFKQRLARYLAQMGESGGFLHSGCYIYADGRVTHNGKTFDLSKAEIQPFEMSMKQPGFFGSRAKLDLRIDRDVVHALVDHILKNPQIPSDFVRNWQNQHKIPNELDPFVSDLVSLLAKMSGADGKVSPEEVAVVRQFLVDSLKLEGGSFASAIAVFNREKGTPGSFEDVAERVSERLVGDDDMLSAIIELLYAVATADGELSAEEAMLLEEAEEILGVECDSYRESKKSETSKCEAIEIHYQRILGVTANASAEQIRIAYKRLVMKFHPDRMHGMGPEIMRQAESKMKEINKAYEFLKH